MAVYPERRGSRLTGKWIAEVTHDGERRRKRFETKHEGERWADYIKLTGVPPVVETGEKPKGPTVSTVAQEASINHAGWEGGRDKSLKQRLAYVVDTLGPDTSIEDVHEQALDKVVNSLKRRPGKTGRISPQTINRYLAAASAVLSYAKSRRYIETLPAIPWQKWEQKRMHWLTPEQEEVVAKAMVQAGKPVHALVMRVLTATGMRWSEFATLTPGQIDGEWIKLDRSKTNTPRDIPIDAELAAELRGIIIRGEVPAYQPFRNSLKQALKSAGQNTELSVHGLRHSTATRLVHADVNLAVVKDFLGHSSLNTTLKYTHVTKPKLMEAAKILSPHAGHLDKALKTIAQETPANKGEVEATVGIEPTYTDLQSEV